MYITEYIVRRFSKTPLKHRMSKYFLEQLLEEDTLLDTIAFVEERDYLSNTLLIAQAGTEGDAFDLELGAVQSEEVTLVNGRLVKEKKKSREIWVRDPVEALQVLRNFQGTLHVKFVFLGEAPDWYRQAVVPTEAVPESKLVPGFAAFIRDQIDLALLGITLKNEIEQALAERNEVVFREKITLYKQVCHSCFWKLS